jgi:integrase
MGLGPLARVSLAKARQLASEARRQRLEGGDPIVTRKAQRKAARLAAARGTPFKEAAEQVIASHEAGWRNAKHRQQWRNTLESYAYPILGHLPVGTIDTDLVLKVLQPIWTKKPETAGRIRGRIEAVLNWAKARGLREGQNPAQWRGHLDQLLPPRSKVRAVRHHPALPYAELPAFMARLHERTTITARCLEFTILTAARSGEARGARFEEFDLAAKEWTVPAARMKGGRPHRVALSPRAVEIVEDLAELGLSEEYVFPGQSRGQPLSDMSLLQLLRELRPGITTHGFRSTFKDWAAEATSFADHVSEAALAHASADKVRAAYARGDLFEKRRKLMEAWAKYCERAPSEVLALRWRGRS